MQKDPRPFCYTCRRTGDTCYCLKVRKFHPGFTLILVVHPREARKTVGTVRIAHLSTEDSFLFVGKGEEIDQSTELLRFLDTEKYFPAVLFPGPNAIPVELAPSSKPLALFVIDGTWHQASRMMRNSRILSALPRLAFSPDRPSEYQFRTQPMPHCVSTVEAVHTVVEKRHHAGIYPAPVGRAHDRMLEVFREMVQIQLNLGPSKTESPKSL